MATRVTLKKLGLWAADYPTNSGRERELEIALKKGRITYAGLHLQLMGCQHDSALRGLLVQLPNDGKELLTDVMDRCVPQNHGLIWFASLSVIGIYETLEVGARQNGRGARPLQQRLGWLWIRSMAARWRRRG